MSLRGKCVVVTRAPHQAGEMTERLQDYDAVPLIYPCIDIAPVGDSADLDSALRNMAAYDWLLLTSTNTVLALQRRLQSLQLSPDWSQVQIAAVGESTAHAIEKWLCASVAAVPDDYTAAALAETLPSLDNQRVLLPQSNIAKPDLAETLVAQGAHLTQVPAYQTVVGHGGEDIPALLAEKHVHALTFTSGSTVVNFVERVTFEQDTEQDAAFYALPTVCIGPRTQETALEQGFTQTLVPDTYTIPAMLKTLNDYFS